MRAIEKINRASAFCKLLRILLLSNNENVGGGRVGERRMKGWGWGWGRGEKCEGEESEGGREE